MTRSSDMTEDAERSERHQLRLKAPTLVLVFTKSRGIVKPPEYLPLAPGTTLLGRAPTGGQAIAMSDDSRCSRVHARIERSKNNHLELFDEKSRNGTIVNGTRSVSATLADGDLIRIGDSLLVVRADTTPEAIGAAIDLIIGDAPATRALRSMIRMISPTAATVLLLGESGTGKEVAAQEIHRLSGREGAFVPVNASAIPEAIAESQLFGHEAGAFTGATSAQPGFIRLAEKGTLFLDEIGDLPIALQPKLLRALEDKKVWPLGATRSIPVDTRIVAATNADLSAAISDARFRGDLYARLSEMTVEMPPLRERREDVLLILEQKLASPPKPLSADLAEALLLYAWPYNVRELVKLAVELDIRARDVEVLELEMVAHRLKTEPCVSPRSKSIETAPVPSREELEHILLEHQGSIADVARVTGRSRTQVYRWLKQRGIDIERYRQ